VKTQVQKIENVFSVSSEITINEQKGAVALLISGDLFHQPAGSKISRRLDHWLYQTLRFSPCPIITIPGNHDMQSHHLDSLKSHPYGCLESAGLITSCMWPNYFLVGNDPLVLVTGKEFTPEGPGYWLDELRDTQSLIYLKKELSQQHQKSVFVVAMTHSYWGENSGYHYSEPVIGYSQIHGTGIDVMLISHDHTCHGVQIVQESNGTLSYVVGPGALLRGTIAEKDVRREPKMAVLGMDSKGAHEIFLVTIPHRPADEVFDFEEKEKTKKRKDDDLVFIEECRKLNLTKPTMEVLLSSILTEGIMSPRIAALTRDYLLRAEDPASLVAEEVSGVS
jgi:DNA repair exonuclease SbcCD nuclease subunit